MHAAKNPDRLLKAMIDHERVISRLYSVYAKRFPDYKDFWSNLSREETEHAACLDFLGQKVKDGSGLIVVERFSLAALDASIKYVESLIEKASDADFELINALSLAFHLEEAMIEKDYFEAFEGDSPQVVRVLDLLAAETRKHSLKIKEALEKQKKI